MPCCCLTLASGWKPLRSTLGEQPQARRAALLGECGSVVPLPAVQNRARSALPFRGANIPTASACKVARCHASARVFPSALITFSPFVPVTIQTTEPETSPTDQPAAQAVEGFVNDGVVRMGHGHLRSLDTG
jgi:hypothetical protein